MGACAGQPSKREGEAAENSNLQVKNSNVEKTDSINLGNSSAEMKKKYMNMKSSFDLPEGFPEESIINTSRK